MALRNSGSGSICINGVLVTAADRDPRWQCISTVSDSTTILAEGASYQHAGIWAAYGHPTKTPRKCNGNPRKRALRVEGTLPYNVTHNVDFFLSNSATPRSEAKP